MRKPLETAGIPTGQAFSGRTVTGSAAISVAANQLGVPDPVALEDELTSVAVDALVQWFHLADAAARALSGGGDQLGDVLGSLAAGWSSPEPRALVLRQWEAARAGRRVICDQLNAVEVACVILRQTRLLAGGRVAQADSALRQTGWPTGAELLPWAAANGQLPSVTAVVTAASEDLATLRHRNEAALHELAAALRHDPRQSAQDLMPIGAGGGPLPPAAGLPHQQTSPASGSPIGAGSRVPPVSQMAAVEDANNQRLTADLHSSDIATSLMALGITHALAQAREHGSNPHLLVYESANSGSQGRAAIGVGDLTTADNVAVVVPGIANAPFDMAAGVSDAVALRTESERQAPDAATAVIAWYGYDIPLSSIAGVPVAPLVAIGNAAAATNDSNARFGGLTLNADMAALRRLAPANARWVPVGFSMGSTTVSAAAAQGGAMDDLVLLGSPGAGQDVTTAEDYRAVTPEHTFVTAFDQDPVTRGETDVLAALGGTAVRLWPQHAPFGPDPATRSFGAQVVDVESNEPDVDVDVSSGFFDPLGALQSALGNEVVDLAAHHQQGNYLGGRSLEAVAAVVIGHYGDVPIKPGR